MPLTNSTKDLAGGGGAGGAESKWYRLWEPIL